MSIPFLKNFVFLPQNFVFLPQNFVFLPNIICNICIYVYICIYVCDFFTGKSSHYLYCLFCFFHSYCLSFYHIPPLPLQFRMNSVIFLFFMILEIFWNFSEFYIYFAEFLYNSWKFPEISRFLNIIFYVYFNSVFFIS